MNLQLLNGITDNVVSHPLKSFNVIRLIRIDPSANPYYLCSLSVRSREPNDDS